MTREEAKQFIFKKVKMLQGIKLGELAATTPIVTSQFNIFELVEELIHEKLILEIEYSINTFKVKSFLLPRGSRIERISHA